MVDEPDKPKRVVGKKRTVLEVLDGFGEGVTMKDIVAMTNIPYGTVYDIARDLQKDGYVTKETDERRNTVLI